MTPIKLKITKTLRFEKSFKDIAVQASLNDVVSDLKGRTSNDEIIKENMCINMSLDKVEEDKEDINIMLITCSAWWSKNE